ncbi:Uncharacterised protein [Chromobacterium violaceum]|uniref:Uncharacterized protein n=1 Tax=Chromobacterium violaceum TaxID=536 RepID=A0A447TLH6_CHRVL|nr:Uncharacterised protein [Chromobacterium violaceum]
MSGPDVGVQLSDGRRLAIEVTEVLSGEHTRRMPGKRKSSRRPAA